MSDTSATNGNNSRPPVPLLKYLLGLRDNLQRQLLLHMGEINVHRMVAFTDGYRTCQWVHGLADEEYGLFLTWLREVKQEFPGEGWDVKYLRDCAGDHERAIRKYLDLVAEFVSLRERRGG
jgi:hypothetical protein